MFSTGEQEKFRKLLKPIERRGGKNGEKQT